jgi:hypothetical protein
MRRALGVVRLHAHIRAALLCPVAVTSLSSAEVLRPNHCVIPIYLGRITTMAMIKKKTRKAIRKSFNKVIKKHGPAIAEHLATGAAVALATYLGAEGKKGGKKLTKIAKKFPGSKHVRRAVSAAAPALKAAARKLPDFNGDDDRGTHHRSKKHASS